MSYPSALDTDLTLYVTKNRLQTTLLSNISNSVTTVGVASTTNIVAGTLITIDNEIMYVSTVGATLTVIRGYDSTTAIAHSAGSTVSCFIDAIHQRMLKEAIIAIETVLGVNGVNLGIGLVNVKSYGAIGNGIADDTTAINNALAAAAGKTLYFPSGTYKTTGSHHITASNTTILGTGWGSIITMEHATNNIFYWDTEIGNLQVIGLNFTSTISRTAGWVLCGIGPYTGNCYLTHSHIVRNRVTQQVGGFWIPQFNFVWVTDNDLSAFVGSGATGIKFGQSAATNIIQGTGAYLKGNTIYSDDFLNRSLPRHLDYGLFIQDCNAIEWCGGEIGGCLISSVKATGTAHGVGDLFFVQLISDGPKTGPGVHLTGIYTGTIMFDNCWFASAGIWSPTVNDADGFKIDATTVGQVEIRNSRFFNNLGNAINVASASGGSMIIANNVFISNGNGGVSGHLDSININNTINNPGPYIFGNRSSGAAGYDLRTSATSNLTNVGNNVWESAGAFFGIDPKPAAFYDITCNNLTSTNALRLAIVTYSALAAIVSPINGTLMYCSDGQVTSSSDNTIIGGGTGALAVRIGGIWRCFAVQN